MPGIGIGISPLLNRGGGTDWSSYWATLISATVENAAPTSLVMTFSTANTSLVAGDFTLYDQLLDEDGAPILDGDGDPIFTASTITVLSIFRNAENTVLTLTLSEAISYGDVMGVSLRGLTLAAVTNNVLSYAALLTSTGTGAGVSTLRMQTSADITVTLGDNAKFYSDAAGTLDESATWTITSGALRTIYLKCTTGTATMTFSDASKVTKWGGSGIDGWTSGTNAASITIAFGKFPLIDLDITGSCTLLGSPPMGITGWFYIYGGNINWTYSGALPAEIAGRLFLFGDSIYWSYNGALPPKTTYVRINGMNIDYTGLDVTGTGNITLFSLANYRQAKMSSADMITLLNSLTNRAGALPATITINDYADYASPPAEVVNAVNALKAAKSITTVDLGA